MAVGNNRQAGILVAADDTFVPEMADVISPAVVAQVFEGITVPFKLNADGSVGKDDYLAWLAKQGQHALLDLNSHSEIVTPHKPVVRAAARDDLKVAA